MDNNTFEDFDWDSVEETIKQEEKESKNYKDDRLWKITHDKEKSVNFSVIRLMPQPGIFKDKNLSHYVRVDKHNIFIGTPGNWEAIYAENDPEMLHGKDTKNLVRKINPMNDIQRLLFFKEGQYKPGKSSDSYTGKAKAAREESNIFRSKSRYYTNIMVVVESNTEENERKHFIYEFGPQFYNFLESKMNISEEMKKQMEKLGEEQQKLYNPMSKGWNIKLVTKPTTKNFAYETEIDVQKQGAVFKTSQEAIKWIQENCVDLSEFTDESNFKSYEELKESAITFFKRYTPKYMEEEDFRRVVKQVLGNIYDDEETQSQIVKEEKNIPTETVEENKNISIDETVKEEKSTTEKVKEEDIDDFLAGL